MADVKWIKLYTDLFDNRKIKHIRKLPEGNNILLIWIFLLTLAGRCNAGGMIFLTENIPYTVEMLADESGFDLNTVKLALEVLSRLDMISINPLLIGDWENHQNVEGMEKVREQTRKRVANCRARQKELAESNATCNVTVTQSNAIDIDIEKDIDKKENTPYGVFKKDEAADVRRDGESTGEGNGKPPKRKTKAENAALANRSVFDTISKEYGFSDRQTEVIQNWLLYKAERGDSYNERGMKSLLTVFKKNFEKYGTERVSDTVEFSSANMYAGIVWDTLERKGTKQSAARPGKNANVFLEMLEEERNE